MEIRINSPTSYSIEGFDIGHHKSAHNSHGTYFLSLRALTTMHRYSNDMFHILVLQEYWVLIDSRIQLMPVLGGVRIVALSISSREQTQ